MVKSKVRRGATTELEDVEAPTPEDEGIQAPNVIDLTALLQKSLKSAGHGRKHKTT